MRQVLITLAASFALAPVAFGVQVAPAKAQPWCYYHPYDPSCYCGGVTITITIIGITIITTITITTMIMTIMATIMTTITTMIITMITATVTTVRSGFEAANKAGDRLLRFRKMECSASSIL